MNISSTGGEIRDNPYNPIASNPPNLDFHPKEQTPVEVKPYLEKNRKFMLYLNSNSTNCTKNNGADNIIGIYTWRNLPPLIISKRAILRVASFGNNKAGLATTWDIVTIRLRSGILWDTTTNYTYDAGFPILTTIQTPYINSSIFNEFSMVILPQTITEVGIQVTQGFTNPNNGFDNTALISLALFIEEDDDI